MPITEIRTENGAPLTPTLENQGSSGNTFSHGWPGGGMSRLMQVPASLLSTGEIYRSTSHTPVITHAGASTRRQGAASESLEPLQECNEQFDALKSNLEWLDKLEQDETEIEAFLNEDEEGQCVQMLQLQYYKEQLDELGMTYEHHSTVKAQSLDTLTSGGAQDSAQIQSLRHSIGLADEGMRRCNLEMERIRSFCTLGETQLPDLTALKEGLGTAEIDRWGPQMSTSRLLLHLQINPTIAGALENVRPKVARHMEGQLERVREYLRDARGERQRQMQQLDLILTGPLSPEGISRLVNLMGKHGLAAELVDALHRHPSPPQLESLLSKTFEMLAEQPRTAEIRDLAFRVNSLHLTCKGTSGDTTIQGSAGIITLRAWLEHHARSVNEEVMIQRFIHAERDFAGDDGIRETRELKLLALAQNWDRACVMLDEKLRHVQLLASWRDEYAGMVRTLSPDKRTENFEAGQLDSRIAGAEERIAEFDDQFLELVPPLYRLGDLRDGLPPLDAMAASIEGWPRLEKQALQAALEQYPQLRAKAAEVAVVLDQRLEHDVGEVQESLEIHTAKIRKAFAQLDLTALNTKDLERLLNAVKSHDNQAAVLDDSFGFCGRDLFLERLTQEFVENPLPAARHYELLRQTMTHVRHWPDSPRRNQATQLLKEVLDAASFDSMSGYATPGAMSPEKVSDLQRQLEEDLALALFIPRDGTVYSPQVLLYLVSQLQIMPVEHRPCALDWFVQSYNVASMTNEQRTVILGDLLLCSSAGDKVCQARATSIVDSELVILPEMMQWELTHRASLAARHYPSTYGSAALTLARHALHTLPDTPSSNVVYMHIFADAVAVAASMLQLRQEGIELPHDLQSQADELLKVEGIRMTNDQFAKVQEMAQERVMQENYRTCIAAVLAKVRAEREHEAELAALAQASQHVAWIPKFWA